MCTGKIKNAVQASKTLSTFARHRKARLEFAERHLEWTVKDWKKILWSDETKINWFGSDRRNQVWIDKENRRDPRRIKQTVKFGGGNLTCLSGPLNGRYESCSQNVSQYSPLRYCLLSFLYN